jgi:hypothetical protein
LLFAFLISALVAITAASFVLLVQAVAAQNQQALLERQRAIAELAKKTGGVLNPRLVAEHFSISYFEADRLMRGMVDDRYFKMKVDDREAELVFWFTELVEEPNASKSRRSSRRSQSDGERPSTRSSNA